MAVSKFVKPAVGGLLLGGLALFFPQVLGGGYDWIQSAIEGNMATSLMLGLAFAKIVATSFTISSGEAVRVRTVPLYRAMLGGFYGNLA